MKLEIEFKVGDIVVTEENQIGYIDSICECEECKRREFNEPHVTYIEGGEIIDDDYITAYEYEYGLTYYTRIGANDLKLMRKCQAEKESVQNNKESYNEIKFNEKDIEGILNKRKEFSKSSNLVIEKNGSLANQSVSILNRVVDLTELNKKIGLYEIGLYGNKAPYLIMSQETADAMANCYNLKNATKFNYGEYWRCPIAICNKVKFGEVELR